MDGEDGDRIREIEMSLFHDKYKDHESWKGTDEDNSVADINVAKAVRLSLATFMKNRKRNKTDGE